jgi:hypothetical protein
MPAGEPLLVRMIARAIVHGRGSDGDPVAAARRWVEESEDARSLRESLVREAEHLWEEAERQGSRGAPETERALRATAVRLWNLVGENSTPA